MLVLLCKAQEWLCPLRASSSRHIIAEPRLLSACSRLSYSDHQLSFEVTPSSMRPTVIACNELFVKLVLLSRACPVVNVCFAGVQYIVSSSCLKALFMTSRE